MNRQYQVQSGDWAYTVVDDTTTVYAAVITGSVTDQLLGGWVEGGLSVAADWPDLRTLVTPEGLYAVTGYPGQAFPQLSSTGYTVTLTLNAPGYASQVLAVAIPQNSLFPVVAPPVALLPQPVQVQGRVVQASTRAPIAGALVLSVDNPQPPPSPSPTLALRTPLYNGQKAGTAVQAVALTNVGGGGAAPQLTQPVAAGTNVLALSTLAGLTPGALVQVANQTPTVQVANQTPTASKTTLEYGVVAQLVPAGPGQSAQAVLTNPLNRSYGAERLTSVSFFTAAPTGAAGALAAKAAAGDGLIGLTSWLSGSTVMVGASNASTVEYHEVGALTDNDGFYAMSGVGGVQDLFLQASSQGSTSKPLPWFIEYDEPNNVVNFQI